MDERNFVKKAVNWALRNIGNQCLYQNHVIYSIISLSKNRKNQKVLKVGNYTEHAIVKFL